MKCACGGFEVVKNRFGRFVMKEEAFVDEQMGRRMRERDVSPAFRIRYERLTVQVSDMTSREWNVLEVEQHKRR